MKVVFRVDASTVIGVGHLMRCLTLAQALRERGVQVGFVCRKHAGNLIAMLLQNSILVVELPAAELNSTAPHEDYTAWLGVTQTDDAEQTIKALNGERPDWLVVDHYGLDFEWERRLRPHASKLLVIDDLANRRHECDVLLDQNYSVESERRYADLVPDTCKLLVGPRYALLRPEYAEFRKTQRARDGLPKRALVFFGGSDQRNMTGLTLEVLSQAELRHLVVDVVLGPNNPHRTVLEKQAIERPNTTIYDSRPHLADLISQADLAIGAGGATTWERMCLGLPTVVISIAENQRPVSEALAAANLIHYAGHFSNIKVDQLRQLLENLIHNTGRLTELRTQSQLQVDGLGALRLAELLCPTTTEKIYLRPTCEEDVALYWYWANEPEVRNNAMDTKPISWATHEAWFANKLLTANSRLFVLEAAGLPVGQVRFDQVGDETFIDYSLDSIVRKRGWGSKLIAMGIGSIPKDKFIRLRADVKARNHASSAVFLRLGFAEIGNASGVNAVRSFYSHQSSTSSRDRRGALGTEWRRP